MINESCFLEIARSSLTLADARKLSKIVFDEYRKHHFLDQEAHFSVQISCSDQTEYQGDSLSMLGEGSPVEDRLVEGLTIKADGIAPGPWKVDLEMVPGDSPHRNYVRISGADSAWVQNVLIRFEEAIASLKPEAQCTLT